MSSHSPVVKVAAQRRYRAVSKGVVMATNTRNEPKAQAMSWLVSQLRWERTLDALRGERGFEHEDARQAA
jgi:hypothetical protein